MRMTTLPTFQGCSNNSVGEMCKTGLVQILIHSKCSTNVSRYYLLSSQQTFATSFLSPHYQEESGPLEVSDVVRMPSHPHRSFFWSHSFWSVFKRHEPFGFMGRPGHRLWFPGKLQAASRLVADFSHPGVGPKYKWKAVPCSSPGLCSGLHLLCLLGAYVGLGAWRWSRCGHILSSSK